MPPPGKTPLPIVPESESSTVLSRKKAQENTPQSSEPVQAFETEQPTGSLDQRQADNNEGMSLQRATVISLVVHIVGPIGLALITGLLLLLLSWLLHFNFWDWFRDKHPPHDLEFVLIEDTQAKRPTKPLFKGSFNQQAGGKKQPQLPVRASESPAAGTQAPASKPKTLDTPATSPPKPDKQSEPSAKSLQTEKPPDDQPMTNQKQATASPVSSPEKTPTTPSSQPSTSPTSPTQGTGTGDSQSNPQDGNTAKPGVDVAQDVDFGPFMADMERRIKHNWVPPRGSESRKVKLLFYLLRDGRLSKVELVGESKDPEAERAAIAAIEASAPFMPLPPKLKEDVLPIEFTFDYNVLNPKKSKQKSSRPD
jgi:TonB family protein